MTDPAQTPSYGPPPQRKKYAFCVGCAAAIVFTAFAVPAIIVFLFLRPAGKMAPVIPPVPMPAGIRNWPVDIESRTVMITNSDSTKWTNVVVSLNPPTSDDPSSKDYVYRLSVLGPQGSRSVPFSAFHDSRGHKFKGADDDVYDIYIRYDASSGAVARTYSF